MNNNKGISLIEVLVAVGIMSIMSFFMMDMINNQNKAIKTTQFSMDVNDVQNQVQKFLIDSETCKNTLAGYSFPVGVDVPITAIKRTPTNPLLSVGSVIGGVNIESFIVRRISGPDLELSINLKKINSSSSYGSETYKPRKVNLAAKFKTSSPNEVETCFTSFDNGVATALQLACAQLCPTCTWNAATVTCVRPTTPSPAIYLNPNTGALSTQAGFQVDGNAFCNCYNPGCPSGSSQQGAHWCTSGGTASKCGYHRWKYGHVNCKINQPLGYLTPTP